MIAGGGGRAGGPRPPGWAVCSAVAAPVLLIGGWSIAAARQPAGYSAVRDTISALAARTATDRWVMTGALIGVGLCHIVTALGLRAAATPGRVVLATGGVATVLFAAFPLDADGNSTPHGLVAAVAFGALAGWPAVAVRRGAVMLRPPVGLLAAAALVGLVGWFAIELVGTSSGGRVGLAERVAAAAQALWPAVVVVVLRAHGTRSMGADWTDVVDGRTDPDR